MTKIESDQSELFLEIPLFKSKDYEKQAQKFHSDKIEDELYSFRRIILQALSHQLCMAHLLRDLNHLIEIYPKNDWPVNMKQLLQDSLKARKKLETEGFQSNSKQLEQIEVGLDELLKIEVDKKYKKITSFRKRLIKNRNYLFKYLYHYLVSSDNNGSERAIRNVKIKQKVSGQFRSESGARSFAIIRSVIDTIIKRNKNIFDCLAITANLVPE